jgi:hypothetical protein
MFLITSTSVVNIPCIAPGRPPPPPPTPPPTPPPHQSPQPNTYPTHGPRDPGPAWRRATKGRLAVEAEVMGNQLVVMGSNIKNIVSVHVLGCAPENLELSGHRLREM